MKIILYLLGTLGTISIIGLIGIALYCLEELFFEK